MSFTDLLRIVLSAHSFAHGAPNNEKHWTVVRHFKANEKNCNKTFSRFPLLKLDHAPKGELVWIIPGDLDADCIVLLKTHQFRHEHCFLTPGEWRLKQRPGFRALSRALHQSHFVTGTRFLMRSPGEGDLSVELVQTDPFAVDQVVLEKQQTLLALDVVRQFCVFYPWVVHCRTKIQSGSRTRPRLKLV